MKRRISLRIATKLYEELNAAAWARVWQMLPPDTKLKGAVDIDYGDDTYTLRLISNEFEEVGLGARAPEYDLEAQGPQGTAVEAAQFTIRPERYGDPEPGWVRYSPSVAQPPVSPTGLRAFINSNQPNIPGGDKMSFDYGRLVDLSHEQLSQNSLCICDMAYTGRRTHSVGCPRRK